MNTRNTYRKRAVNKLSRHGQPPVGMLHSRKRGIGPLGYPLSHSDSGRVGGGRQAGTTPIHPSAATSLGLHRHPLADLRANTELERFEKNIKGHFEAIFPVLKKLANLQHEEDFPVQAQAYSRKTLGYELPQDQLENAWVCGLDMRSIYAHCVFGALRVSIDRCTESLLAQEQEAIAARKFILDCGFHCVDVTSCSDGRLKGLFKYILRLPLTALTMRDAYAGGLFDVEANIRRWESVELSRFRSGEPVPADAGTRYLKVVVYHYSSSDPTHQGCAAHGSNDRLAAEAGLALLYEFRKAIENSFCCGASIDILLIGVDTDTDAIRIHVPDGNGDISVFRYVDNAKVYQDTLNLNADDARIKVDEIVRNTIDAAGGCPAGVGQPHEGMRRFIVNLLINNLSQIEYVNDIYGGRYPDIGHAERYISVGDGFHEVQVRNLAYYAHLHSVEEGAADLDVGIKIFKELNVTKGLPVPVAIHYRYDSKVPGSRKRMLNKCKRVKAAIESRYADLVEKKLLICQMSLQDRVLGSEIEVINEGSA